MRRSREAVEALAGQEAVRVKDDSAHHRVGAGPVVRLARQLDGAGGPVEIQFLVVICGIQSWQYTRAKSNHPVIDNRKVYEILQCLQRWIRIDVCEFSSVI